MAWALMMIRLDCACRKMRGSRMTGIFSESMMSRRTFPAPTLGSWSMSPTSTRRMCSGIAFIRLYIRMMSIIEHSSTISASPSSGFSSLRLYPSCGLNSSSRWMVLASIAVASLIRLEALPVGAASRILIPAVL